MDRALFPLITTEEELPFYLTSVGGFLNQTRVVRRNGLQYHQWLHCTGGQGKLIIDGTEHIIGKGTGFFMRSGIPHEYYAVTAPWETRWVCFDGKGAPALLETLGFNSWGLYQVTEMKYIDRLLNDIYMSAQIKASFTGYHCSGLVYSFLLELKKSVHDAGIHESPAVHGQLRAAVEYMEKNYGKSLALSDISSCAGVSEQYLCRIFKKELHMRPFEYLMKIRLQKAKELLIGDDRIPAGDIAPMVGFNDFSYFCNVFRRYEGMTPGQFREEHSPM